LRDDQLIPARDDLGFAWRLRAGAREGKLFFERLAPASQFTLGDNVTIIGILR